uniref:Putative salivary lipocalin n=1 Tax=Ixodes ricinus TaxID=34613 RepID=A0A0K8R8R6_IXORI
MSNPVFQCILGIALLTVEATTGCRKGLFAERLGRYPDAWRILINTADQFFLAFYSYSSKTGSSQTCLHTIRRTLEKPKPWTYRLVYGHTLDNTTLWSGNVEVGITKTNQTLVFDDAFNTTYKIRVGDKDWRFEDRQDISEIIYTNFNTCIVMHSKLLGYQVWVKGEYPTGISRIPYLCTFLYEACAGRRKHFAYNKQICPKIKPKNSPNSGLTREPRSL